MFNLIFIQIFENKYVLLVLFGIRYLNNSLLSSLMIMPKVLCRFGIFLMDKLLSNK